MTRTSWNTTRSNLKFEPLTSAPFSSVTLPMRPSAEDDIVAAAGEAGVLANAASTSRPTKPIPLALLSIERTFAPGSPLKTTGFFPAGRVCLG